MLKREKKIPVIGSRPGALMWLTILLIATSALSVGCSRTVQVHSGELYASQMRGDDHPKEIRRIHTVIRNDGDTIYLAAPGGVYVPDSARVEGVLKSKNSRRATVPPDSVKIPLSQISSITKTEEDTSGANFLIAIPLTIVGACYVLYSLW